MCSKNTAQQFVIIALAVVIGLSMASCKNPTGGTTKTYMITFNANGGDGTVPGPQSVNAGSGISLPNEGGLSKTGYIFGGWNTRADGTGYNYSADSAYIVESDVTLYARWNIATYTVIFNLNGGSGTPPLTQTVEAGSGITLPDGSGLSKTGFTFGGWNTNTSGTGTNYNAGSSYSPTDHITLYANWEAAGPFTVTFNANGGSGTPPPVQTVQAGSGITLPDGSGLSKTDYNFGSWNTNISGNGTNYNAGSSYIPTGDITLYARWITAGISNYTITFDVSGWSETLPSPQTINQGGKVTEPAVMARAGFTFGGWFKEAALANQWNFASDTVTGNTTLYAKWNINQYTVTFNDNNGTSASSPQTIDHGGRVTEPLAMTRDGYTFGGWFKEAELANQWNLASDTVTDNITLYAKWDINQYTVTFNANRGTPAPAQQTIDHGGKVTEPAAMTRTGYTFDGWFKEAALTNEWDLTSDTVSVNITLYAKWKINQYTVSFRADGGTPAPRQQTVNHGGKVIEPEGITKEGYRLGGWFKEAAFTNGWDFEENTVTANMSLYAKWNEYTPPPPSSKKTPVASDYDIGNLIQTAGSVTDVTITPKAGSGVVTAIYYNGLTMIPQTVGSYTVTFDVAAATGWNAASGLSAGTLTVNTNKTPIVDDYTITGTGTFIYDETAKTVTVTKKDDSKSPGTVTVLYNGSNTQPVNVGTYTVTFNVAAATGWNEANGLFAGTLSITNATGTSGITLDVKQITEGAPVFAAITISRSGSNKTYTVSVSNQSDYTSIAWEVAGVGIYAGQTVTGSGASFTLNAAEVKYNSLGGHALILTVTKSGEQYQRAIPFTIVQ